MTPSLEMRLRARIDCLFDERSDLQKRLAESEDARASHLAKFRGARHSLNKARVELLLVKRENARLRRKVAARERTSRRLQATLAERT